MANNLVYRTKALNVATTEGSAGTAVNSSFVDLQGYDGAIFIGRIATSNSGNFANLAQATATSASPNDLAGTRTSTGGVTDFRIDVYRPEERYVRLEYDRSGTSTALGDTWAILYGAKEPGTPTADHEFHATPTEGTA